MCVPDLRRIIAALMALLMKLAFEFNGIFNMIFTLVAPLMMPFLMSLLNPIQQFMALIIQPLQCVINAITAQINNLDYSKLIDPSQLPSLKVSIGPQSQPAPDSNAVPTGVGSWGKTFNLNPAQSLIAAQQKDLNQASTSLSAVKASASTVDFSDPTQAAQYQQRLTDAQNAQTKAANAQVSAAGQASAQLRLLGQKVTSYLWLVVSYIKEAIQMIQNLINALTDEIKKMLSKISGGNGLTIMKLYKKLEIVQIINLVLTIIKFIDSPVSCNDNGTPLDSSPLSLSQGLIVTKNPDGSVTISEDPDILKNALSGQSVLTLSSNNPIVSKIVTPQSVTFKCPLNTTVEEAQQVNKWISELAAS
jgi:hypothetical protein